MLNWIRKQRSFRKAQDGIAYVEFAITLPFLLALFMGAVEVTRYILVVQKVEKAALTMSDLVAQSKDVDNEDLTKMILAASQVMLPYTFGDRGYSIVTSVTKNGTNPPIVNWQYVSSGESGSWTHNSEIGSPNGVASLPDGFLMTDKENVIFSEIFYSFTPLLLEGILTDMTIYKVAAFRPRLGDLTNLGG